jgi:hypothetical protein
MDDKRYVEDHDQQGERHGGSGQCCAPPREAVRRAS